MSARTPIFAALAVLQLVANNAMAAPQQGFYGRAELGRAAIDESLDSDGVQFRLDDSGSSWRLALGYAWNDWVAVEAGYNDFGSVSTSAGPLSAGARADGLELGMVLRWPVSERFSLTGRAGYLWWDAKTFVSTISVSDSGSESFAGFGAEYQAGERTAVTVGWTRYQLDDLDVDYASVGLRWRFGQ